MTERVLLQPREGGPLTCRVSWILDGELITNIRLDFPDIKVITIPVDIVPRDSLVYFLSYISETEFNYRYCADIVSMLDYFGCSSDNYTDLYHRIKKEPINAGDCLMRCVALKKIIESQPKLAIAKNVCTFVNQEHATLLVRSGSYSSKFISEYVEDNCPVLADWKMSVDTPLLERIHSKLKGVEYAISGEYMMAHALGLDTSKLVLVLFGSVKEICQRLDIKESNLQFSTQMQTNLRISLGNPIRIYGGSHLLKVTIGRHFGSPETQVMVWDGRTYATPGWHLYDKFVYREYQLLKRVPLPLNVYSWSRAANNNPSVDLDCEHIELGNKFSVSNVHFPGELLPLEKITTDTSKRIPCFCTKITLSISRDMHVCIADKELEYIYEIATNVVLRSILQDGYMTARVVGIYDPTEEPDSRAVVFADGKMDVNVLVNGFINYKMKERKSEILLVLTIL